MTTRMRHLKEWYRNKFMPVIGSVLHVLWLIVKGLSYTTWMLILYGVILLGMVVASLGGEYFVLIDPSKWVDTFIHGRQWMIAGTMVFCGFYTSMMGFYKFIAWSQRMVGRKTPEQENIDMLTKERDEIRKELDILKAKS